MMWALIGYAVGVIFSILIFRPMKNWQEGYDTAKKTYGDWGRGFDCGYDAAAEHYTDYKQGFYDGYRCGAEEARNEGRSDQQENGG